jgi:RNA polymerase sigma-70 factor (sigma-E family)
MLSRVPQHVEGEQLRAWNPSVPSFVKTRVGTKVRRRRRRRRRSGYDEETGQFSFQRAARVVRAGFACGSLDAVCFDTDTGDVAGTDVLEDLVRLHHRRLVALAYALCGNRSEAEDIVADAFARTWPRLARGQIDEPAAYLRRAVVNGTASWRRHRFVVRREELRRRVAPAPGTAEDDVAVRDELWQALQTLPLGQRQVVVLRFIEDLSEADTATVLGIPTGTVKSRTARALVALRQTVHEDEDV